jgi:hypothetical protein
MTVLARRIVSKLRIIEQNLPYRLADVVVGIYVNMERTRSAVAATSPRFADMFIDSSRATTG